MIELKSKKTWRDNALNRLFGEMWRFSTEHHRRVVWCWVMFIVAESVTLVSLPLIMAAIIDVIQKQSITLSNIWWLWELLAMTLVAELVFWGLHGPARLMELSNAFFIRANYRKHLLQGVMTLPMEWHVEHHSGDTIDKVEKGTNALFQFSENSFEIIYSVVQLVISYGMLVYFSPSAAYLVLIMIMVTAWITIRFDRVLLGQYRELNHAENSVSESVFDAISNITTVIILRVERLVFEAIVRKVESPYKLYQRNNRLNEVKWFLTNVCCNVMTILVLGVYFYQHIGIAGGVLIGNVYLLIQYLGRISELFFKFTSMYGDILQRKAKILNAEELSKDFRAETLTNHVLPPNWQQLSITDLCFSYGNMGNTNHLNNVALTIRRGERIALVGESGSGKTTLLMIMRDLYHPSSMNLAVDGRPLVEGFAGISRAITLVPQAADIFARTVLENITVGAGQDMKTICQYTDMACFTDVVNDLPRQFDSSMRERGVNLSGGEKQRLALSRGLLASQDKDIVLLDEPTSSLDTTTERQIYENIFTAFGGKTIISSIHNLHLLPLFDTIYFF